MPPRKQRAETAVTTVRTKPQHRDVADLIADEIGISRSDLFALLFAQVCNLERPKGTPADRIDVDDLPRMAADVEDVEDQAAELYLLRGAFRAVADRLMDEQRTRRDRRRSVHAALDALAPAILSRHGGMDVRTWSLDARLSGDTLNQVRAQLRELGLVEITKAYAGGAQDRHHYGPGPAVRTMLDQLRNETRSTRGTPPAHA